ncbi:MAG TPA: hypothetical protein VIK06_07735 [Candidatus Limnocylindrales bacterium]|jgi:hypothetical protein
MRSNPSAETGSAPNGASVHPAGMCTGAGHMVVYGNPAFVAAFGAASVGLPAREVMLALSSDGFAVMDAVVTRGRPAARWVRLSGEEWRLTVAPTVDPGTAEVYGMRFHLRPREASA